jgi:type IV secretion system protein VirD4
MRGFDFSPLLLVKAFKHYGFWKIPDRYLLSIVFATFVAMLPIYLSVPRKNKYGSAKFASSWDIGKLGLSTKRGLLLGKAWDKFLYLDKPLSVLLIAPAGTGKTSGFVVPQVLTIDNSTVVHDPKGEVYDLTAQAKREQKFKVLLFNPNSANSCKFNILDRKLLPKESGKLKSFIGNVAEILIRNPSKSASNEFFYQKARTAFSILAAYVILKNDEPNIAMIRDMVGDHTNAAKTFLEIIDDKTAPDWLKKNCKLILQESASGDQWAGITGTLTSALDIFDYEEVVEATSGPSDIHGNVLRDGKTIVYIKIDTDDRERLAPLVSLVFYSLGIQLTTNMPADHQQRVTFIIDEFPVLGKVDTLIKLPSISRGYNLNIEFIAQDFDQIIDIYGHQSIGIMQSNCAFKIILQQSNLNTAEGISRLIGNKTAKKRQSSSNGLMQTSISSSDEGIPLVTYQEILHMNKNKFLLLCQGGYHTPIVGDIPFYFQEPKLKRLVECQS